MQLLSVLFVNIILKQPCVCHSLTDCAFLILRINTTLTALHRIQLIIMVLELQNQVFFTETLQFLVSPFHLICFFNRNPSKSRKYIFLLHYFLHIALIKSLMLMIATVPFSLSWDFNAIGGWPEGKHNYNNFYHTRLNLYSIWDHVQL